MLPANERRRAAASVRWALAAAQEAVSAAAARPARSRPSSPPAASDGETLHRICEALASAEREVSPTRFHNSVHNAAAGYWTHRGGLAPAVGEPVRLRRLVRRGPRRGREPGRGGSACRCCSSRTICRIRRPALRRAPVRAAVRRCAAARAGAACPERSPACRVDARARTAALHALSRRRCARELAYNPAGRMPCRCSPMLARGEREPVRLGYLDGCQLVVELRDMVLSRDAIAALIPHQGAMCLLDEVLSADDDGIVCRAVSHRDARASAARRTASCPPSAASSTRRRRWRCTAP